MTFNKNEELKTKYDYILNIIIDKSKNEKLKKFMSSYSNDDLDNILKNFCNDIDNNSDLFKLLINRDDKLFLDNSNIKIIPSFDIIPHLNNEVWESIQLMYAIYRTGNDKLKSKVQKIIESVEKNSFDTNLKPEKNDKFDADDMVMDIADTLRDNLVSASKQNTNKINPIENMIKTSQMISDKYASKIKSGNISINDMFQSLNKI